MGEYNTGSAVKFWHTDFTTRNFAPVRPTYVHTCSVAQVNERATSDFCCQPWELQQSKGNKTAYLRGFDLVYTRWGRCSITPAHILIPKRENGIMLVTGKGTPR